VPPFLGRLFFYAVVAALLFGTGTSWTRQYFGGGDSDAFVFIWFLNWWPFAVAHHINPFVTAFQWFPRGDNVTWDTSVPFAALIGWPVTAAGGAALTFNLLSVTAPVLSAWTGFLLARFITRDWAASVIGGYLFGFSSYELGQLVGHLNLDMIWLVPLAGLLGVARARRRVSRRRYVVGLAAVLGAEFGLSTEIFATLVLFGAVLTAVCLAVADRQARALLFEMAVETLCAILLVLMFVSPYLFYMMKGADDLPPAFNSALDYSADLLNFLVPTSMSRFTPAYLAPLALRFSGNVVEQGAYLGLPVIGLIVFYFATSLRSKMTIVLAVMMVVLVVSSLGPVLRVGGVSTHIWLPWDLVMQLPLIGAALPTRLTMYVSLCACVVVSLWLALPTGRALRIAKFGFALFGCGMLLPNQDDFPWTPLPEQAFFQGGHEPQSLGEKARVLILPFGGDGGGGYWQVEANMQFRQAGGYLGYVPRREAEMRVVDDLVTGQPDPEFGPEFADYCQSHGVQYVLVGPGAEPGLTTAVMAEGWKTRVDSGVTVISVPDRGGPLPSSLNGG